VSLEAINCFPQLPVININLNTSITMPAINGEGQGKTISSIHSVPGIGGALQQPADVQQPAVKQPHTMISGALLELGLTRLDGNTPPRPPTPPARVANSPLSAPAQAQPVTTPQQAFIYQAAPQPQFTYAQLHFFLESTSRQLNDCTYRLNEALHLNQLLIQQNQALHNQVSVNPASPNFCSHKIGERSP
jgi:hypothetical protein